MSLSERPLLIKVCTSTRALPQDNPPKLNPRSHTGATVCFVHACTSRRGHEKKTILISHLTSRVLCLISHFLKANNSVFMNRQQNKSYKPSVFSLPNNRQSKSAPRRRRRRRRRRTKREHLSWRGLKIGPIRRR